MKSSKTCYGMTYLKNNETAEENTNHRIELEYYKVKKSRFNRLGKNYNKYGIEIQKREYKNHNINVESNSVENITNNKEKVIEIINTLKKYKVTPIGLNDVLEDLQKQQKII